MVKNIELLMELKNYIKNKSEIKSLFRSGLYEKAFDKVNELLIVSPYSTDLLLLKYRCAMLSGKQNAMCSLKIALALEDEGMISALIDEGYKEYASGTRLEASLVFFEKARAILVENLVRVTEGQIKTLAELGRDEEAITLYKALEFINLEPDGEGILMDLRLNILDLDLLSTHHAP